MYFYSSFARLQQLRSRRWRIDKGANSTLYERQLQAMLNLVNKEPSGAGGGCGLGWEEVERSGWVGEAFLSLSRGFL